MSFLNHYSYAIAAVLVLLAAGAWAMQRRTLGSLAMLVALAVVLVGVNLLLRPGPPSVLAAEELDRALAEGKPALVEFYSDY